MRRRRKRTNANVPAKGRLRDIADKLWSLAVRADWAHRCAVCGHGKTEAHHLVPRQAEATRYDLRNGIALCANHHQFDPAVSPHQNAAGWLAWLEDHHPELAQWYLDNRHPVFTGTKTADYYCGIIRGLKQYLEDDEYERIVGIRFSTWLEDNYGDEKNTGD